MPKNVGETSASSIRDTFEFRLLLVEGFGAFRTFYDEFILRTTMPYKEYGIIGKPVKILDKNAGTMSKCLGHTAKIGDVQELHRKLLINYTKMRTDKATKNDVLEFLDTWLHLFRAIDILTIKGSECAIRFPRVVTVLMRDFLGISNLRGKTGGFKNYEELKANIEKEILKHRKMIHGMKDAAEIQELLEYIRALVNLEEMNKYILPPVPTTAPRAAEGGGKRRSRGGKRRTHRRRSHKRRSHKRR